MNLVSVRETSIKRHHLPFYLLEEEKSGEGSFYQEFQNLDKTPEPQGDCKSPAAVAADGEEQRSVLDSIRREERGAIIAALRKSGGNVSAAGRLLGISRQTLVYRMKKHGIH